MNKQRYRKAIKSTSIIGGAAFINMFVGLIKTKFIAILLGPAGLGLINLFSSMIGPITTVANMGFHTSGVRSIASKKDDFEGMSIVVKSLRRLVWLTGILGLIVTIFLSPRLSFITFKTQEYSFSIAFLGLIVLFSNLSMGQVCLLQGTRRITEVAKVNVWSAFNAVLVSVPCFWFYGEQGIVPSLVLSAFMVLLTSWWFVKKIQIAEVNLPNEIFFKEARKLFAFGLPVMATAVQATFAAYILRLIIVERFGVEGVGVWSASYAISSVLVNFVLRAMGTDYFPRLVVAAKDSKLINEEINAQLEIGLLLSLPALFVTILFAPIGISILYSGKFDAAIPILRWSIFGIFCRVISWPLGYTILAQGRGGLLFWTELSVNIFHVFLVYYCSIFWGLKGTGFAFTILCAYHFFLMVFTSRIIAKTRLSRTNLKLIVFAFFVLLLASFFSLCGLPSLVYNAFGVILAIVLTFWVYARLSERTGITSKIIQVKIKKLFHHSPLC